MIILFALKKKTFVLFQKFNASFYSLLIFYLNIFFICQPMKKVSQLNGPNEDFMLIIMQKSDYDLKSSSQTTFEF